MSRMVKQAFYGGQIPQYAREQSVPGPLVSTSNAQDTAGPNWRYGGLVTYEKPITEFFPDIVIGPSSNVVLRNDGNVGTGLPRNCVGIRFINLIANVTASINGGGGRTILNNDVLSNCEIYAIQILTDAAGTVTVQAVGTGD